MKIAVASGKGGTGKTTVAVALALSSEVPVTLLDCDVEEPNAAIFIKPRIMERSVVTMPVPVVDNSKCNACGDCAEICRFNAIVALDTGALVFPELCHNCGGCARVCPTGAISEEAHRIGALVLGEREGVEFVEGLLDIGQPSAPPLIRAVKRRTGNTGLTVIDCPPGTSCPLVAAVKDCDFAVLVTEPTPFGLNDLRLAVDTMRELGIPMGVVINQSDIGDDRVEVYCRENDISVLARIPEDRRVAEAYSKGRSMVEEIPEMRMLFKELRASLISEVAGTRSAQY